MRRNTTFLCALAATLALSPAASIAGPKISTQAAPGVNFAAYKTYSWLRAEVPSGGNPILFQQIVSDFDSALAAKGYQKVETDGDLSLILTLGAQEKTDVQTWGRFGLQTSVYQYTQGQLSLDAFDTKTKQAVWHGQASQTINPDKPKPDKINQGIQKLMADFPAH